MNPLRAGRFKVVDAVKSVVAIENVYSAIDQIAQTALRKVGCVNPKWPQGDIATRSSANTTLDETLSETDKINLDIQPLGR